ncbi:MAG TPA: hypothetical protein VKZ97_00920, partial [Flavobacteriaceae bacterium]|nr:hypothetical protein [Flavobacteriaceae bacterium]
FIWPAIIRNTIGDVYYISDDAQIESNEATLRRQIEDSFSNYNRKDIRNDRIAKQQLLNLIENKKIYFVINLSRNMRRIRGDF